VSDLVPFRLAPLLVPKPWGGSSLTRLGRDVPEGVLVGESWDLADLDASMTPVPDPVSLVVDGPLAGCSLRQLVLDHAPELLGPSYAAAQRFPLLVKHLDARQHLSVQVHPPLQVMDRFPQSHLKTESWVVVAADPDAYLMIGLRPDVTPEQVRAAAGTAALVPLLQQVPAHVGDVHHVPPGVVHALGAGVVVVEVQSPSDTTFRLYDWPETYGRADRALHLDDALVAVEAAWELNVTPVVPVQQDGRVVQADLYTVDRLRTSTRRLHEVPTRDTARVVVVLSGRLRIPDLGRPLETGELAVLPAAWSGEMVSGAGAVWLEVDLAASLTPTTP
jgi:mannose-6-phosphate isomerase